MNYKYKIIVFLLIASALIGCKTNDVEYSGNTCQYGIFYKMLHNNDSKILKKEKNFNLNPTNKIMVINGHNNDTENVLAIEISEKLINKKNFSNVTSTKEINSYYKNNKEDIIDFTIILNNNKNQAYNSNYISENALNEIKKLGKKYNLDYIILIWTERRLGEKLIVKQRGFTLRNDLFDISFFSRVYNVKEGTVEAYSYFSWQEQPSDPYESKVAKSYMKMLDKISNAFVNKF